MTRNSCFFLAFAILALSLSMLVSCSSAVSMGLGNDGVDGYSSRIEIWENAAGNNGRSKLDEMNINRHGSRLLSSILFASSIVNDRYSDAERKVDTFTYLYEIQGGFESDTFDDIPYLVPYLVDGSDAAVIVIPGGGFGFKSIDGATGEGADVARTLNENGINAFVLHYRSNPYEYPIPYLDVQRAVRYLRYNSGNLNIDPDKISLIGFSAGGNVIGTFINIIQGNDFFPSDYKPDVIDSSDDGICSAAMIYPALSFRNNVPMLFCLFDDDEVRNRGRRAELLEMTDLYLHIDSQDVPQFIAYGTRDRMVGMDETLNYINYAEDLGCDVTVLEAKGQDHNFGQDIYMEQYLQWLKGMIL